MQIPNAQICDMWTEPLLYMNIKLNALSSPKHAQSIKKSTQNVHVVYNVVTEILIQ